MDIQGRIRELMLARKWTYYRLAKEAGVSVSTVTNLFKRKTAPTVPTLEAICGAFNMTLAYFFSELEKDSTFTVEQRKLLSQWSTLSQEQRDAFLALMTSI